MLKIFAIILNIILYCSTEVRSQNLASELRTLDICVGKQSVLNCTTSYKNTQSIIFSESFYGIQKAGTLTCGYNAGDCTRDIVLNTCGFNNTTCSLSATTRKLVNCQDRLANYLRLEYFCVPYEHPQVPSPIDICSNPIEITSSKGFIQSPGYPAFKIQNTECQIKIKVPIGKSINVWVVDMSLNSRDTSGDCKSSYLKVIDSTDTFDVCSNERQSFYNTFCSNQVYITYKADEKTIDPKFKGFRLYYETFDVSSTSGCTSQTPPDPNISTTKSQTFSTPALANGQASKVFNFQVCKSNPAHKAYAPLYYLIFVESLQYGVPATPTCEPYSLSHCLGKAPVSCNLKASCSFSLPNVNISACNKKTAQYLYGTYRYIPIQSTVKYEMCDTVSLNADEKQYGLITSKNFPNYQSKTNCTLRIETSNPNKVIKFYITEIDIDVVDMKGKCSFDYLSLTDGITSEKHCGHTSYLDSLSYTSCSNSLTINYVAIEESFFSVSLTGFRAYYEITDRPSSCPTLATTVTTTPSLPITTTNPNSEVISPVNAIDSFQSFQKCVFPFIYKQIAYRTCINNDQPDFWCSLTDNFDRDQKRGTCEKGLTRPTQLQICTGKSRKFSCPEGYVIHFVSADYVVTSDGTCDYSKKNCTSSATSFMTNACGGKSTCTFNPGSKRIPTCSNINFNIMEIDFRCIPDTDKLVKKSEFCSDNNVLTENYGIIQTKNYPTFINQLNCSIQFSSTQKQLIRIYAISIDLELLAASQECNKYWLQINDEDKLCRSVKSSLIHESCSDSFQAKISIDVQFYKGAKLFYEVRPIYQETLCPATIQPTSYPPSTSPIINIPIWQQQGLSSQIFVKNLCFVGGSLDCPANYAITIRNSFYGISNNEECFYDKNDCKSFEPILNLNCAGKRNCYVPFTKQRLPECNYRTSEYIQIEYDCIPNNAQKQSLCNNGNTLTQSRGILTNPNYPSFDTNLNCDTNIQVNSLNNSIIKVYIKDMLLDEDCSVESLTLSSPNSDAQIFCGQQSSLLVYETCSNTLKINLKTSQTSDFKRGVSIYYEEIVKPSDFNCAIKTTKPSTTTSTTTTSTTTTVTVTRPSYDGFASPLQSMASCDKKSYIYCPQDYLIVMQSSVYGVKTKSDSTCSYDQNDCTGLFLSPINCSGEQNCTISFSASSVVTECQRKPSDYFYVTWQCIPTNKAGTNKQPNIELCSNTVASNQYKVAAKSSAIFQSVSFPTYPNVSINCTVNISIEAGNHLQVYLNTARFRGSYTANCTKNTEYVSITDGFETFRFCANSFISQYLFQSRSTLITVEYSTTPINFIAPFYKGFQLYVEAFKSTITAVQGSSTSSSSPAPITVKPGFASSIIHDEICSESDKTVLCPKDYIILLHKEHLVETNGYGCTHTKSDCLQPTDIILNYCSGKQSCSVYFPETKIARCRNEYADLLDFEYQCVPTSPLDNNVKTYTCDDKTVSDVFNGFVQSPKYPEHSYGLDCILTIRPPKNYAFRFYLIDLSLKNTDKDSCNMDFLLIDKVPFCLSSPALYAYFSNDSNPVDIRYKSLAQQQAQYNSSARGFKLYFEAYSLIETTTKQITTTPQFYYTIIRNPVNSSNLTSISLGIGIPFIVFIAVVVFFIMKKNGDIAFQTRIKYSAKDNAPMSFANPISSFD